MAGNPSVAASVDAAGGGPADSDSDTVTGLHTTSRKLLSTSLDVPPLERHGKPWKPKPGHGRTDSDETVVVIAANTAQDDVSWAAQQPYDYVVMNKGLPEGTPNNLVVNAGGDAASYTQFIIEHYDQLPARIIFVHGHKASWHNLVQCTLALLVMMLMVMMLMVILLLLLLLTMMMMLIWRNHCTALWQVLAE